MFANNLTINHQALDHVAKRISIDAVNTLNAVHDFRATMTKYVEKVPFTHTLSAKLGEACVRVNLSHAVHVYHVACIVRTLSA